MGSKNNFLGGEAALPGPHSYVSIFFWHFSHLFLICNYPPGRRLNWSWSWSWSINHSSCSIIFMCTWPSSTSMRRHRLSTEVNPMSHMRSADCSQPSVERRRRRRLVGLRPTSTSNSLSSRGTAICLTSPDSPIISSYHIIWICYGAPLSVAQRRRTK